MTRGRETDSTVCASCGAPLNAEDRFCRSCGKAVPPREEAPPPPDATTRWPGQPPIDVRPPPPTPPPPSPPPPPAASSAAARPRVGGWAFAIAFFGLIGGWIGWLSLKGSDRRRADHVLKWSLIVTAGSIAVWALLVIVLVASFSHNVSHNFQGLAVATDTTANVTPPATTTTATTPSASLGPVLVDKTITISNGDGYSATAEITVYRPAHASVPPTLPISGRSTIDACSVNGEADAVIPVGVNVTNTTANFSSTVQVQLAPSIANSTFDLTSLQADADFSAGPTCDSYGNGSASLYGVNWSDPLTPGQHGSNDFYLIVPGYYSPAHPHGNPALLAGLTLIPSLQISGGGTVTVTPADPAIPVHPANPLPPPRPAPAKRGSYAQLKNYVVAVDGLLRDSAATRKQLVAAIAESAAQPAAARQAVAAVVSGREDELRQTEALDIPPDATAAQTALTHAFTLSLASDRLYQRWLTDRSHSVYVQAQTNDRTAQAAKIIFLRLYNELRPDVGLAPLRADYAF